MNRIMSEAVARLREAQMQKLAARDDGRVALSTSWLADLARGAHYGQPTAPEDRANQVVAGRTRSLEEPYSAARQLAVGRKGATKGKRHPKADLERPDPYQFGALARTLVNEGRGTFDEDILPYPPKKESDK